MLAGIEESNLFSKHRLSAIVGLIPVKLVYIALDNAIGFEKTILKKSSLVISRGLALSMVSGIK